MAEYTSKVVLGTGEVLIDLTADTVEASKLLSGITAHGADGAPITGTLAPASGVTAQTKNATPSFSAQSILPDSGYDYPSEVDIAAISVVRTENAAGGYTVTIG